LRDVHLVLALKGSDDVVHQTLREKGRGGGREGG